MLRSEVEYAINILKNNESLGRDKIHPEVLVLTSDEKLNVLTKLLIYHYLRNRTLTK